jgi:riboflavin transporter FmnP
MNARSIALIATFAAIAIALNTIRIPTIYWPGFSYHFNEIPIVVAFLLFGPKIGALVGVLHLAGQLALFPIGPTGIVAYPMGLVALLVMLLGMYLASRFTSRRAASEKPLNEKKRTIYFTAFAAASRGGIMPFLAYGVMYHVLLPLVLGISIPETYIAALVPSFVLYNVTVPLYTVPISYLIARRASIQLRIETPLLSQA